MALPGEMLKGTITFHSALGCADREFIHRNERHIREDRIGLSEGRKISNPWCASTERVQVLFRRSNSDEATGVRGMASE